MNDFTIKDCVKEQEQNYWAPYQKDYGIHIKENTKQKYKAGKKERN